MGWEPNEDRQGCVGNEKRCVGNQNICKDVLRTKYICHHRDTVCLTLSVENGFYACVIMYVSSITSL